MEDNEDEKDIRRNHNLRLTARRFEHVCACLEWVGARRVYTHLHELCTIPVDVDADETVPLAITIDDTESSWAQSGASWARGV
jgi:hypothetical protein